MFDFKFFYFFFIIYFLVYILLEKNNPLKALLRMICLFIIQGLFLIENHLQYFGFILIIIYVGAIAIMFLFVIFLLNEDLDLFIYMKDILLLKKKFIFFFFSILFCHLLLYDNNNFYYYSSLLSQYAVFLNFYLLYDKNYFFNMNIQYFYHIINKNYDLFYIKKTDFQYFFKIQELYDFVCYPIESLALNLFIKNFFIFFILCWLMFIIPLLIIFSCKLFFKYKEDLNVKKQNVNNQNEILKYSIFKN